MDNPSTLSLVVNRLTRFVPLDYFVLLLFFMVKCALCKEGLGQNTSIVQCKKCLVCYHDACIVVDSAHSHSFICNRCYLSYLPFSTKGDEVDPLNTDDPVDDNPRPFLSKSLNDAINDLCKEESSYFDINSFNELPKGGDFNLIHFNSRSLNKNINNIEDYLSHLNHNFTAIGCTETWLKDDFSSLIHLKNYNLVENHRQSKRGGGVCLFIKDDILFNRRNDISPFNDDIESIFVEISASTLKENVIVGVVYRPPGYRKIVWYKRLIE